MFLRTSFQTMVLLILAQIAGAGVAASDRGKYNFNFGWKVFVGDARGAEDPAFNDEAWKSVTLPYAWNEDDAFRKDIVDLSTGIAWYRKTFRVPAGSKGKKFFLEFEGIRQAGEFYLNGRHIGRSENGIMAFGFDITDQIRDGENVLAARIDNDWDYREKETNARFQWSDKNFNANYGGINKNVYLHVTDRLYQTLPLYSNLNTTGVYVYAADIDVRGRSARVVAETEVRNEHPTPKTFSYSVVIEDMNGRTVKRINGAKQTLAANETKIIRASDRVANLNFWSWGYGYLYNVQTILSVDGKPVDAVTTRTGFRKTDFSNGMFRLNDRTLHLKGYAQRSTNEWVALGSAVPAWLSDFSNGLMVESNANLVRWMHVTPSKQDVESCDRVGLIQAMPAGDAERDATGRAWEQRLEVMRDAVIYNRNNPSVVFYEAGNKGVSEEHMQQMKEIRDRYDPHGGRASGSREMLNSKTAEYGGEMLYINKSSRIPMWQMEYSRDEGLRKYWDEFSPPYHKDGDGPLYRNQNAAEYNRNQDSHAIENIVRWFDYWEARPGTGKRVNSGGVNIIFSDSNTHHRGAENYRRSGEVDAVRLPKDGFYSHQVMWDGWVDVERPRTHIIGHWNYQPGTKKNVYVVSSADKVELFINGKLLGSGMQSGRFLFTFKDVAWKAGEIKAVGYNSAGKRVTEDAKRTAGVPAAIRLTPRISPNGFRADGNDIALVDVEVVDKDGNRCPTALDVINFSLEGEAEWRGGIAQGPDNYVLAKSLPVENGVNRVLMRSTTRAGRVALRASSGDLRPTSIELTTKPFAVRDGLSLLLPGVDLPSNLTRGATPSGESFRLSRLSVDVANVSVGSNPEAARNVLDDDETTNWTSDGKAGTGWIRYDLARTASISQVVLKVVGWRTQSYPVRVLVDETVVFTGNTPRSLGYVTISFPATAGKSVQIELTGNATNRDAFGNIVEIPGTPDAQSQAGKGGERSTLGIVEIEVYEPVSKP